MPKPKKKGKPKNKKKKHTKRRESKKQRIERERRRKEREMQQTLRDIGREIYEISKEILEGQTGIKSGWAWGTPFVRIGPCDEQTCDSPMHQEFLVEFFEGECFFHCNYDELRAFSQTERKDFPQLGEFAMLQDEKEGNALLGWEISQISSEILSNEKLLNAFRSSERIYGSPVVRIRTCDGNCNSPLHKYFLVLLYDEQLAFHCDFEELVNFSQIDEIDDFIILGEHAITEVSKEQFVTEQQERGTSIDVVTSEEVDEYLAEHPELLDHPAGRAQAIAKVSLMKDKRIEEAEETEETEETEDD
ncbi:MAG: hypothetical protein ACFFCD_03830 [Promethearchaeota archaeon]